MFRDPDWVEGLGAGVHTLPAKARQTWSVTWQWAVTWQWQAEFGQEQVQCNCVHFPEIGTQGTEAGLAGK